jgi:hypothetical protein
MWLLYLDDSGSAQNANEDYLVLGGISVFERRVYFVGQELDSLASRFNEANPEAVEFHASEIFGGRTEPWKQLRNQADRKKVLLDVLAVLSQDRFGTCAFACAVHKPSFPNDDPMQLAFEQLCNRFDRLLKRKNLDNHEQQRGMIIFDESAHETAIQALARSFRTVGTRWGVTRNIAEVPMFINSKASRCIQLADHVAYAVFRRYQGKDTSYLDSVLPKFDADQGIIHGLVHKQTYNLNCMCPACMCRRIP